MVALNFKPSVREDLVKGEEEGNTVFPLPTTELFPQRPEDRPPGTAGPYNFRFRNRKIKKGLFSSETM